MVSDDLVCVSELRCASECEDVRVGKWQRQTQRRSGSPLAVGLDCCNDVGRWKRSRARASELGPRVAGRKPADYQSLGM